MGWNESRRNPTESLRHGVGRLAEHILREITALVTSHTNAHVREWKQAGRPVVAYFCRYTPPEILLAAGALPLRLRAPDSDDSSLGDAYLSGRICTFVRHVMSLVLDGQFDFLDGEVSANTCDHVRRSADVFVHKSEVPFHGFVSVPRAPRVSLFPYYLNELKKLIAGLEAHLGVSVTDESLRQAVRDLNRTRALLAQINMLRLEDKPRLTGAEALSVHIASQVIPPQIFADLATRLLEALAQRPGLESPRGRLVLAGAELDEPAFVAAVESQGALVVADHLCWGARSVLDPIDEAAPDILEALARAYFFHPSCARMIGDFPARWDSLKQLVSAARAHGVVFQRLIFCDPWGAEIHNILHRTAQEHAFPVLSLSREYGVVATGQIKTRVQAFLEMIEISSARAVQGGAP